MKNPSPSCQEMQLSGGKDVKLFGDGNEAPCETGNAASSNSANAFSRCKRRKSPPYRSRSEPRQEVRAGLINGGRISFPLVPIGGPMAKGHQR